LIKESLTGQWKTKRWQNSFRLGLNLK